MKVITKHKLLLHFIDTVNNNCESRYYIDPALSEIPKELFTWVLGIPSSLLIQYLISVLHLNS